MNPNGILTLNVGPNAQYRFFKSDPNDPEYVVNEQIGVVHADPISGDLPGEAVYVSEFGMVQRYDGVKKIVAVGGTGNESISIGEDIGEPRHHPPRRPERPAVDRRRPPVASGNRERQSLWRRRQ